MSCAGWSRYGAACQPRVSHVFPDGAMLSPFLRLSFFFLLFSPLFTTVLLKNNLFFYLPA